MLPAVELLRNEQSVRHVVSAGQERLDAAVPPPLRQALPEIGRKTCGGLVAVLGILGEELHHDRRKRPRDARDPFAGRCRLSGDVAVHPFHRVGGGEGQFARQHLVEGDPERVEIAAGVDRPIHPAGLFGGHVGERPRDHLRRRRGLALAWQARGDAKAHEPDLAGDGIHQKVRRLDVLMDEAALVNLGKRGSNADRKAQKRGDLQGPSHEPQQGLPAGVLDQERRPALVRFQPQGPGRPGRIERLSQRMGALQPRQGLGRGLRR